MAKTNIYHLGSRASRPRRGQDTLDPWKAGGWCRVVRGFICSFLIRRTGSAPVAWHTDWCGYSTAIKHSGDVLNRGSWLSGKWFYLTGSRPEYGGLCVIEDSHAEGWEGPEGFRMTADRRSFYPEGAEERAYNGIDPKTRWRGCGRRIFIEAKPLESRPNFRIFLFGCRTPLRVRQGLFPSIHRS